jgi:hypothetical protein
MLTMRRSVPLAQKKVAEVDENSPMVHPPSIQVSIAVMNTRVRLAPATNGLDSMMDPCMLRTTYQRGAGVASSDLKGARRRTMWPKYSVRRSGVHPVRGRARTCMELSHRLSRGPQIWRGLSHSSNALRRIPFSGCVCLQHVWAGQKRLGDVIGDRDSGAAQCVDIGRVTVRTR